MEDDDTVDINYLKTLDYREVACDGVIGGLTPSGKLHVAFYTERFPIARISRHKAVHQENGVVTIEGHGEKIDGRQGIVRNLEFGIYLSVEEAEFIAGWLVESVKAMKGTKDD